MGSLKAKLVLSLLMLSCLAVTRSAAKQSDNIDTIDSYISERMADLNIPGAAVAVVRDGKVVHLAGYGIADKGVLQ